MSLLLAQADARQIPLADASVHLVVSSPPYFGLRQYETGTWQGGDPACLHTRRPVNASKDPTSTLASRATNQNHEREPAPSPCPSCGAVRVDASLGNECLHDCLAWARQEPPCGQCYVCALRGVMQEVWRVLRSDGTAWIVIGDSYHAHGRHGHGASMGIKQRTNRASALRHDTMRPQAPGLPPKSLIGIPHRLALALQSDGWVWRSDIIWHKLNGMPESVQDRPTSSHEHVLLFSKQPQYFWDQEAMKETATMKPQRRLTLQQTRQNGHAVDAWKEPRLLRAVPAQDSPDGMRTCRDVWSLSSEPYAGAHYAAFPLEIPRRAIVAATSQYGCCTICHAPWRRVVERETAAEPPSYNGSSFLRGKTHAAHAARAAVGSQERTVAIRTIGWEPTCPHRDAPVVPAVVLDPFTGSSATLQTARELGRHAIGLDLSWNYLHRESRTRLGLAALAAWQHGEAPRETAVGDLPLFAKGDTYDLASLS
jgi:DNA modification methylase